MKVSKVKPTNYASNIHNALTMDAIHLHCLEQLLCIFQILTNLLNRIKKIKLKQPRIANTEASNVQIFLFKCKLLGFIPALYISGY